MADVTPAFEGSPMWHNAADDDWPLVPIVLDELLLSKASSPFYLPMLLRQLPPPTPASLRQVSMVQRSPPTSSGMPRTTVKTNKTKPKYLKLQQKFKSVKL